MLARCIQHMGGKLEQAIVACYEKCCIHKKKRENCTDVFKVTQYKLLAHSPDVVY